MNPLNRMEVDSFFKPDEIATEIFRQYPHLKLPIPLEDLAEASGVIDILPLEQMECDALEGMVVFEEDKEAGVIFYQPHEENIGRQRFTIAHELGHFLIRNHSAERFVCLADDIFKKSNSAVEAEANQFAASLLMPNHLLQPHTTAQPNLELFKELSLLAKASFEAFSNSFIKHYSQPLALVYTQGKKCRYIWKNWAFHKLNLPMKVKKDSDVYSPIILEGCKTYCDEFTELAPAASTHWLYSSSPVSAAVQLQKQTYFQRNQFAVTLLMV